jgi:hypothetical protein
MANEAPTPASALYSAPTSGQPPSGGQATRPPSTGAPTRPPPAVPAVGVLGPTAHPGLPLKVFLGVGRCQRL